MNFINAGTFEQTNGGTLNLEGGFNAYLTSPSVIITDGTLSGNGRIASPTTTLAANATVAPGVGIGTLDFAGDLTLQGTYDLEIDKLLGTADLLDVAGILTLDDAILDISYFAYQPGEQSFLIATASGGIVGGFANVFAPANYTLSLQNNDTELWLAIPEPTSLGPAGSRRPGAAAPPPGPAVKNSSLGCGVSWQPCCQDVA